MYRFQHTEHLYFLTGIALFVLLFILLILWRSKKLKKLGDARLINEQLLGFIPGRITMKFILLSIAFGSLVIGWANLQKGSGTEKTQRKGLDVMIALDVSKSMLAKDIQPDRLTRAKQLISAMLDKMKNDRVGLVVFAGKAYLQVPLTIDYGAMKMMLQNVNPGMVPTQGTVIGQAIDMATQSFSQKEKKYKSLIIISDGEDHDETAIEKVKEAREAGVIIHTVGVGSPEGATLFDADTKGVKTDEEGKPIVSKLNEDELKSIAAAGNGTYSLLRNSDVVASRLVDEIDGMEQKDLGVVSFSSYESYFQYFLAIAFLLLLAECVLPGARLNNPKTAIR
jgi:Ca-activated chloride channel family protein